MRLNLVSKKNKSNGFIARRNESRGKSNFAKRSPACEAMGVVYRNQRSANRITRKQNLNRDTAYPSNDLHDPCDAAQLFVGNLSAQYPACRVHSARKRDGVR